MTARAPDSIRPLRKDVGQLKPSSCASRLVSFFADNPDEELTIEQAMVKCGVGREAIDMAILSLVRKGQLEKVKLIRLPAKGRMS